MLKKGKSIVSTKLPLVAQITRLRQGYLLALYPTIHANVFS